MREQLENKQVWIYIGVVLIAVVVELSIRCWRGISDRHANIN